MAKVTVDLAALNRRAVEILMEANLSREDAETVVATLQEAELCGVESHGYVRLLSYAERIRKDLIASKADIQINQVADNMLLVDAGNGLGQIVTMKALDRCMEEAAQRGSCFAFIRNSNHFGTCGYYSRIAARKGFVAIVASNASATMPPFGGVDNMLGTNPMAVSFPAGKYDNFTLDMAMSAVAKGKIRIYEKMGKEIPLGWAMDAEGNDTTDPAKAIDGGLLPMGGHKGYGLAMVVDLLCGILSGAKVSQEIESMFNATRPAELGHMIMILDPSRLVPMDVFTARVEKWFEELKSSSLRKGFEQILIPGELENKKAGVIPEKILLLDKTALALGVEGLEN